DRSKPAQRDLNFFFQAEDGIRDYKVTGVQTCALPICRPSPRTRCLPLPHMRSAAAHEPRPSRSMRFLLLSRLTSCSEAWNGFGRSEERRVGKECRFGWTTDY